jgi:site-specific recombinase XerD
MIDPQKDPSVVSRLSRAIEDYLTWMQSVRYSPGSCHQHRMQLEAFLDFVKDSGLVWQQVFAGATRERFKKRNHLSTTAALNGLSRYLAQQGQIKTPLSRRTQPRQLAGIYEDYLNWRQDDGESSPRQLNPIGRVLAALGDYLKQHGIGLNRLRIEQLDGFMAEFCRPLAVGSCRHYRSLLRGFLSYLHQRGIIKKNLAPLLIGAPQFAMAKPPKFLRPAEVQKLLESLPVSTARELRTYATVQLAYSLGLRPVEISGLRLDDICFGRATLSLQRRKNDIPLELPIAEPALKAVVAYVVGGRPKSEDRHLFLSQMAPYGPIVPGAVARDIQQAMKKAGLNATAYWLRHTYAQYLLTAGASIYEIKEMLGHRHIESSRKYLYIHTELMREVILDEPL